MIWDEESKRGLPDVSVRKTSSMEGEQGVQCEKDSSVGWVFSLPLAANDGQGSTVLFPRELPQVSFSVIEISGGEGVFELLFLTFESTTL